MKPRCYNRPPYHGQWIQDGYRRGKPVIKWMPFRMSEGCATWFSPDGIPPLPAVEGWECDGCMWRPEYDDYLRN